MNKKGHPICKNESYRYHYEAMHRIYTRDKNKFIPIGWICHNCKKLIQDWEIKKYLNEHSENISFRIEINDIVIYNPSIYLES